MTVSELPQVQFLATNRTENRGKSGSQRLVPCQAQSGSSLLLTDRLFQTEIAWAKAHRKAGTHQYTDKHK